MFKKQLACALVSVSIVLSMATGVSAAVEPPPADAGFPLSIRIERTAGAEKSLGTFVERVWDRSPVVQQAKAALEAAQARAAGAARPLYNPELEVETERTDVDTVAIGLNQTMDWSRQREALAGIAGGEVEVAQSGLSQIRQQIAAEALDALVRYATARARQDLARQRTVLMKRFADAVAQRREAGDMDALDDSLARMAYTEALMQEAESDSLRAEAQADLFAVSGLTEKDWPAVPARLSGPPSAVPEDLLASLPSLRVLRQQWDVAKARAELARRQRRPDPTFGLRAGREDSETLLGISVALPLYVRNNFSAEAAAALHDAVAAEQAYREAYRRARARLDLALARYRNTVQAWEAWLANGQEAYHQQASLLDRLWQTGELTATDYLIQAKQNVETLDAAIALAGELWRAAVAWQAASGQVEQWLGVVPRVAEPDSGAVGP